MPHMLLGVIISRGVVCVITICVIVFYCIGYVLLYFVVLGTYYFMFPLIVLFCLRFIVLCCTTV
jgi:hypothetical protein